MGWSPARNKGAAIERGDDFDRVGIGEFLRRTIDGERGNLNLGSREEIEQWGEEIGREGWLVALDVDVNVGVDLAGHFPHTVRSAGAIGRGHDDGDRPRAARFGYFFRVGGDNYRVHQAARAGRAPHPLHHGPPSDGTQDLGCQARGREPRGNDGCDAEGAHGDECKCRDRGTEGRGNEGARERGSKRAREQGNKGAREQGSKSAGLGLRGNG